MKVKVISLPYIFLVLYVLCFTRPRYQVSVYRTIGPLVIYLIHFKFVGIKDMHNIYYLGLSGERSLPFGLLVEIILVHDMEAIHSLC